mgnify:CR=1 FL=1
MPAKKKTETFSAAAPAKNSPSAKRPVLADADKAFLLVIDVQERLFASIEEKAKDTIEINVPVLIQGCRALGLPVIVSEQYSKGLGPTIPVIKEKLEGCRFYDKTSFSVTLDPELNAALEEMQAAGRSQAIVCGIETHVCVYQSVFFMLERGFDVFVPRECVASRFKHNWKTGLALMERCGAEITSIETLLFSMMRGAKHPAFKQVQSLIK